MKTFLDRADSCTASCWKGSRRDAKRTGSLAHGVRISSCRIAWTSMVLARSTVSTPQPAALALRAGQKRRRKTRLSCQTARAPTLFLPSTPSGSPRHTSSALEQLRARLMRRQPFFFPGGARSWAAGDADRHWIAVDLQPYWHSSNHVWLYLLKCSSA